MAPQGPLGWPGAAAAQPADLRARRECAGAAPSPALQQRPAASARGLNTPAPARPGLRRAPVPESERSSQPIDVGSAVGRPLARAYDRPTVAGGSEQGGFLPRSLPAPGHWG